MRLRSIATIPFLLLLIAGGATAQEATPGGADTAAIRQVIERQIAAFQRDDGPAAFAFAAPGIQGMFGDPDTFMEMVRTGYLPVYRPREVEFRGLVVRRGTPIQEVLLVGPDGRPVLALYSMERQADGSWRISGCTLVKAPDETV